METIVKVSAVNGHACVEISHRDIWSLVEFLSYRRTHAEYYYEETHVTVTFIGMDCASAQRLLDEWAASQLAPAGAVEPH